MTLTSNPITSNEYINKEEVAEDLKWLRPWIAFVTVIGLYFFVAWLYAEEPA